MDLSGLNSTNPQEPKPQTWASVYLALFDQLDLIYFSPRCFLYFSVAELTKPQLQKLEQICHACAQSQKALDPLYLLNKPSVVQLERGTPLLATDHEHQLNPQILPEDAHESARKAGLHGGSALPIQSLQVY